MVKTQHMVENRERYERIQKENAYIMKSMHDLKKHVELLEQMKQGNPAVDDYRSDIIVAERLFRMCGHAECTENR